MIGKELKFLATPKKGKVSALLFRASNASHLLVLGRDDVPGRPSRRLHSGG
jgi:hypothetical protein